MSSIKSDSTDQKESSVLNISGPGFEIRPTGIAGLDQILHGGLPFNATVLLAGNSGAGKTILATQWLFAGFEKYKETGIYICLTETTNKAIRNAKRMSFGKQESIGISDIRATSLKKENFKDYYNPNGVHFIDLRQIMADLKIEHKDLDRAEIRKISDFLLDVVMALGAKRVVFDSITAMGYRLKDKDLIRDFVFNLGFRLGTAEASVLLTSEVSDAGYSIFGVEEFIADGIIKLSYGREKKELERKLEVVKMRGMHYDSHPVYFRISNEGVTLSPRLTRELVYEVSGNRLATGVAGFDEMNGGGYVEGSTILVTGASGSGKTILGLQFLQAGLEKGEKCLLVSFEESRDQILQSAAGFGLDFITHEKNGNLKIIAVYPEAKYLDEHIDAIKNSIETFGVKRFVLDSLSTIHNVFSEEDLYDFSTRLVGYLKERRVTSLMTSASSSLMGGDTISEAALSTLADEIIMLRYVEIESELHHAVMILKMRVSAHDKKMREIIFTEHGFVVSGEFKGYEGVLQGSTRKVSASLEEQVHGLFLEVLGPMGEQIFSERKAQGLTYKNISELIKQLGDQGIISERRKDEFGLRVKNIFESK